MTITRTLVAAFAAATIAAPSALAQPIDPPVHRAQPTHPHAVSAPVAPVASHDDGVGLAPIGLGIAGSVVAVGALGGFATRGHHPRRRRVSV